MQWLETQAVWAGKAAINRRMRPWPGRMDPCLRRGDDFSYESESYAVMPAEAGIHAAEPYSYKGVMKAVQRRRKFSSLLSSQKKKAAE